MTWQELKEAIEDIERISGVPLDAAPVVIGRTHLDALDGVEIYAADSGFHIVLTR